MSDITIEHVSEDAEELIVRIKQTPVTLEVYSVAMALEIFSKATLAEAGLPNENAVALVLIHHPEKPTRMSLVFEDISYVLKGLVTRMQVPAGQGNHSLVK